METDTPPSTPPPARDATGPASARNGKTILIAAIIVIAVIAFIIWHRAARPAEEAARVVTVAVAKVTREDLFNDVTVPAEFRPYVEVELHAKVSGYVEKMNVDFGDKVKAGQLLATIEVPELQDQLHSAVAMQEKEEVDYTNANLIYTRLQSVNQQHSNLVAQQELDTAQSKSSAATAAIAAARAEVAKYQTLVKYTQITAPFDGVVTKRYADPGTLIQAGTSSDQTLSLLRVSDNYHLRLDFPISVMYVKDIHVGDRVEVRVDSLNGRTNTGVISRTTDKVNADTRTMTVEVEVDNPKLEIVPGMYASVALKVEKHAQALAVPVQAVGGEKNPTVYVVNENSEIESRPVKLGMETAEKYEVISGLKEGEAVMIGNRSLVHPGQKVETKLIGQAATP